MSEAVTNSDIEDVLSSIRRLIAENPGEEATPDSPAPDTRKQAPAAPPPERGKLVLTPAFRVPDADTAAARNDDSAAPDPAAPSRAESHAAPDTLEGRIAELEAAIGNAPDEWEPDGSEGPNQTPELVFLKGAKEPDAAGNTSVPVTEAEFVDMADDEPGFSAEVLNYSAAGLVLEAEEVLEDDDHPDDHGNAQDDARKADGPAEAAEPGRDDIEEATTSAAPSDDEIVIDEDALRELVSQLVRSELKGRIGQRITRNIRRMVRREIKLALSLRDMD